MYRCNNYRLICILTFFAGEKTKPVVKNFHYKEKWYLHKNSLIIIFRIEATLSQKPSLIIYIYLGKRNEIIINALKCCVEANDFSRENPLYIIFLCKEKQPCSENIFYLIRDMV